MKFYPNSLCIEDLDTVPMKYNWLEEEFESMYISIESCNQMEYHKKTGKDCKTDLEIEDFVLKNMFYVAT